MRDTDHNAVETSSRFIMDDWHPPTEAEMKVIEARRERNDKISSIMGGYLLRGYKMLGDTCNICDTILLQSRQGARYCVACQEVDVPETAKDDPVMNQQAARRLCQEHETPTTTTSSAAEVVPTTAVTALTTPPETLSPLQASAQQSAETSPGEDRRATSSRSEPPETAEGRPTLAPEAFSTGTTDRKSILPHRTREPLSRPNEQSDQEALDKKELCQILSDVAAVIQSKILWAGRELQLQSGDVQRCSQLALLIRNCAEALRALNEIS